MADRYESGHPVLTSTIPVGSDRPVPALEKELIAVNGGVSGVSGSDPCTAFTYHGFNGIEGAVVARIAGWIVSR